MQAYVKNLANYCRKANRLYFGACVRFGLALNDMKDVWQKEYSQGTIFRTWKEWVKFHFSISDSYARKRREVARIVGHYPKFYNLMIPFHEVYSKRNEIESMISNPDHNDIRTFWSELS